MSSESKLTRKIIRYVPVTAAVAGMIMILGSIALLENDSGRIAGVTSGIVALLAAIWYAANPFLKSHRRYLLLRAEVVKFIKLVSQLNRAVVKGAAPEEIQRTKSAMHELVERMVAAAGKLG